MLEFAMDTPPPTTIVLISGDRDFAYVLSKMRLRRCTVVLVCPAQVHPSLTNQADFVLDWASEVLGNEEAVGIKVEGEIDNDFGVAEGGRKDLQPGLPASAFSCKRPLDGTARTNGAVMMRSP